jgi:hypothetical protein
MALAAVCVGTARNRIEVMSHERNNQLILKKLISELRDQSDASDTDEHGQPGLPTECCRKMNLFVCFPIADNPRAVVPTDIAAFFCVNLRARYVRFRVQIDRVVRALYHAKQQL